MSPTTHDVDRAEERYRSNRTDARIGLFRILKLTLIIVAIVLLLTKI